MKKQTKKTTKKVATAKRKASVRSSPRKAASITSTLNSLTGAVLALAQLHPDPRIRQAAAHGEVVRQNIQAVVEYLSLPPATRERIGRAFLSQPGLAAVLSPEATITRALNEASPARVAELTTVISSAVKEATKK